MADLIGRRVLLTGASSGIGAAAAEAFAEAGADLVLVARSEAGLRAAAERARGHGVAVHVVPADLTDRAQVERAVEEAVARLGGLDVLVWNAAGMVFGAFGAVSPEAFDKTMAATFTAAVDTIRVALPHLEESSGVIVATGSIMAKVPLPRFTAYASAKHALRGFLGSLRVELKSLGSPVRVAMVHPGPVDTPLWGHVTAAGDTGPRRPPDTYAPEVMARSLVAAAERPRPEFTVGLEARAIEWLFGFSRPVADLVLVAVDRWYGSGRQPGDREGLLWTREGTGTGAASGGLHGRPSLWGFIRGR